MHSLFIVSENVVDWFNQQSKNLGNGGDAITQLSLSETGLEPATHGWCAVALNDEQEAAVTELINTNPVEAAGVNWTRYDLSTNSNHPHTQLTARGLKLIQRNMI